MRHRLTTADVTMTNFNSNPNPNLWKIRCSQRVPPPIIFLYIIYTNFRDMSDVLTSDIPIPEAGTYLLAT